ncbi:unnamed protein product [Somion occarium]|uniref:F-box domain-containing protein n=1 Tax=Somion occarium TaxID=3059160 RepID=A0ABP1DMY8_9APHY
MAPRRRANRRANSPKRSRGEATQNLGELSPDEKDRPSIIKNLPNELIHHITGYLWNDRYSLLDCITVCRSWHTAALPHLYHTYDLAKMDDLAQLEGQIKNDRRVGYWIKELRIHRVSALEPTVSQSQGILPLQLFLERFPVHLPEALKSLRGIEFHGFYAYPDTAWANVPLTSFLEALGSFASVTTITFVGCSLPLYVTLAFVHALPNVVDLHCHGNYCVDFGSPESTVTQRFPRIHPLALSSIRLHRAGSVNGEYISMLRAITHDCPSIKLQTLHLDLCDTWSARWEPLTSCLTQLGPTLLSLKLIFPRAIRPQNDAGAFTANVKRHVDLGVFTNLRALHIYSLQYRSATLHLLSHLSSPHIREIKLDASFEYIRQIKAKDFMDHDTILAKPHFSNLTEVRVRYSGPLTPKRVERKIVSVFPKTSAKGTLRVVKDICEETS